MQAMTATLVRHLNEQTQFFHHNNKDFKPCMLSVGGERCPVSLFKFFVERRPLFISCNGLFLST